MAKLIIRATSPHTEVCVQKTSYGGTKSGGFQAKKSREVQTGAFEKNVDPGQYTVQFGSTGHETQFLVNVPEQGATLTEKQITEICQIL